MKFIRVKKRNKNAYKWVAVDDEDVAVLSNYSWFEDKNGYAVRAHKGKTAMPMHRMLMNPPDGMCVDHIDRSKTNNQKSNLRICTRVENNYNRPSNNKLGVRGVHKVKDGYQVRLKANGELVYCETFESFVQAVYAYNRAAEKYHGEFAYKNEIKKAVHGNGQLR
jgi:hypothetical protein